MKIMGHLPLIEPEGVLLKTRCRVVKEIQVLN